MIDVALPVQFRDDIDGTVSCRDNCMDTDVGNGSCSPDPVDGCFTCQIYLYDCFDSRFSSLLRIYTDFLGKCDQRSRSQNNMLGFVLFFWSVISLHLTNWRSSH